MTLPPLKLVLTAAGCPGASTLIQHAQGQRRARDRHPRRGHAPGRRRALPLRRLQHRAGRRLAGVHPGAGRGGRARAPGPALRPVLARDRDGGAPPRRLRGARRARCSPTACAASRSPATRPSCTPPAARSRCRSRCCSGRRASTSSSPAPGELGYPDVPVCFKPPVAKGSRGFRILSARGRPRPRAPPREADQPLHDARRLRRPVHRLRALPGPHAHGVRRRARDHRRPLRRQGRGRLPPDAHPRGVPHRPGDGVQDHRPPGARGAHAQGRPPPRTWTTTRASSGSAASCWRSTRASARSCTRRTSSSRTSASSTRSAS